MLFSIFIGYRNLLVPPFHIYRKIIHFCLLWYDDSPAGFFTASTSGNMTIVRELALEAYAYDRL